MKELVLTLLMPPTPFILIMLLGLLWPGQKRRRTILAIGAALFLICSLPIVGKLLSIPLSASAELDESLASKGLPIIVPTAGIYQDPAGRWWPGKESVMRYQWAKNNRGPIFLVGGNPNKGEPSEATVLAEYFPQDSARVTIIASGKNSIESAIALKSFLPEKDRIVHLVTSRTHVLRMAATLKAQGLGVVATPIGTAPFATLEWLDFIPSFKGLVIFRKASYEVFGIILYLARGDIEIRDLF